MNNLTNPCIRKSFDTCGVNPWATNAKDFEKHLNGLNGNAIYKALCDKNHKRNVDGSENKAD